MKPFRIVASPLLCCGCALAAQGAAAQVANAVVEAFEAKAAAQPRLELDAVPAAPLSTADGEPAPARLRLQQWLPLGNGQALGVSVAGPLGTAAPSPFGPAFAAAPGGSQLGLRWRSDWRDDRRLGIETWSGRDRVAGLAGADRRTFGARVEWEVSYARAAAAGDALRIPRASLGMQIDSTSQLVLRPRRSGTMLYYRAVFY